MDTDKYWGYRLASVCVIINATIAVTVDTYSHVAPGLQQAAAEGFDKMVLPKRQKEAVENYY